MLAFLFDPVTSLELRENPDVLIFDSWEFDPEKQVLIRAALDIWNASGNVFLWEALTKLGDKNLSRFIQAIETVRQGSTT